MIATIIRACCLAALTIPTFADASWRPFKPPASLSIVTPEATYTTLRVRDRIWTVKHRNRHGALATAQWPLILRFETRSAVGFAESVTADGQKREALVLRDPDNCLNLQSLVNDLGLPAFDPACTGRTEDETYIEVQTEKFDTFELEDNRQTGNDAIRERLIADEYVAGALLDTPYLALKQGKVQAVGPNVGATAAGDEKQATFDGFGYGADDDFASLVLMANIGGARVFDADFNRVPGVLRNHAGFVNTVSAELLDGRKQTAITATMHPLAGVFEPVAVFDFSVSNPDYAGADYLQRADSAPLTAFMLMSEVPEETDPIAKANEFYDELLATYYPVEFTLRAVVVAGEAPDFIYDLDGDGRFTARDVREAGYQLVTNEVEINLVLTHDNLLIASEEIKCLPRTVLFDDLDGDGKTGEPFKCSGKSGSSRSRRVPR